MLIHLFLRDHDISRYVLRRKSLPLKDRDYFLTDSLMPFNRNERFFRFLFHVFLSFNKLYIKKIFLERFIVLPSIVRV